jgi:hypothetical protein
MKSFKSPQKVVIIFLTLFIMLCCFLIVRLEIKAANLQSQWDEHQKWLKNNEDVLFGLKRFGREVKGQYGTLKLWNDYGYLIFWDNQVKIQSSGDFIFENMNGTKKYFGYDSKNNETFMNGVENGMVTIGNENLKNFLSISDDWIRLNSKINKGDYVGLYIDPTDRKVDISTGPDKASITLDQEHVKIRGDGSISIGGEKSGLKYFGYDRQRKLVYMKGEGKDEHVNVKGNEIYMETSNGKCEINMKEEKIEIICTPTKGPIFGVSFNPIVQSIDIDAGDASIILAKDVIHFDAEGDINITSKNGNVNIKGKKVKVNE